MTKLAISGGAPVFERLLDWRAIWPPVESATEERLIELYRSRRWCAFDETEGLFARAFAQHHGTAHGIFMINGTVTLQCALAAYGIGPGDEVIVPALTWYATAMAAHYVGALPVFVDIEPDTLCIDPARIEAAITPRTKAIIPVHLYGSMADLDRIVAIARAHGLRVIEDCAHMHGGTWAGRGIGSIGDVGSFSFQQSKTMSSAEGGICITNDAPIAERIFRMKQIGYGPGQMPGGAKDGPPSGLLCYPFRATAFQALLLDEQLKTLDARLERYGGAVSYLEGRLRGSTKIRFQRRGGRAERQGYFGWVMIFDDSSYDDVSLEQIQNALVAEGVPVTPTWDPVYRFVLFNLEPSDFRIDHECVVTENIRARMLWLFHAFLALETADIERIAEAIEKVMGNIDQLRTLARRA
jgi:L-glutamine:2-deoxy-scyllo-inosose/3-amino-2,3-dideoxy-scyllo-inosose aminotransferase